MNSRRPIDALLQEFAATGIARGIASQGNNSRIANKHYKKLDAIYGEIRAGGEEAQRLFLNLLSHTDPYVRYSAAARALECTPDAAIPVLESLGHLPGLLGYHAEGLLKSWKAGELTFDNCGRIRPREKQVKAANIKKS